MLFRSSQKMNKKNRKSSSKIMDHFHVPLQSGSDSILKLMRRKYTTADYERVILKLKAAFPQAGIGADVIVGFPGESEEQFEETYHLMERLPLTHFHVFPYSKRKGTTASTLTNEIPAPVKKERVKKLMSLGEQKMKAFMESLLGTENAVLFERKNDLGFLGRT